MREKEHVPTVRCFARPIFHSLLQSSFEEGRFKTKGLGRVIGDHSGPDSFKEVERNSQSSSSSQSGEEVSQRLDAVLGIQGKLRDGLWFWRPWPHLTPTLRYTSSLRAHILVLE